jgi:hypothetical protein
MSIVARTIAIAAGAMLALGLSGCQSAKKAEEAPAVPAGLAKLPISINAVMVSTVSASADFLFAIGNGDLPKDEHDWKQVEYHAYQMILAGQLMQVPGQGEQDAGWVKSPEWKKFSEDLTQIGFNALRLAEAKDADGKKWEAIGSSVVDNCEACHASFKPEIPSQNILHEGGKRASEGKSIFD